MNICSHEYNGSGFTESVEKYRYKKHIIFGTMGPLAKNNAHCGMQWVKRYKHYLN